MRRSLFGYGGTTRAIAKSGGWDIYDDKFDEIYSDENSKNNEKFRTDEFGNRLLNPREFNPQNSELEIPSPGFPPRHKLVQKAQNLISEYDYFSDFAGQKIWISGTNGKTTTTKMTQFLLEKFGAQMGANVGIPVANLDKSAPIWILETSSFTIHYTKCATPEIYALLPITPDHLSWHGSFKEYENAKLKPFFMMKNGIAFAPKCYENRLKDCAAKIYFYENEMDLAKICGVNLGEISFKTPFLLDAVLALCIAKMVVGVADIALLNRFVIEANKLEEIRDKFGRIWVNDTKATNIDATICALRRYEGYKIHLILGGDDKGVDLSPVFEKLQNMDAKIYAIGINTQKIADMSVKFCINCEKCEFLDVAVEKISQNFHANLDENLSNAKLKNPIPTNLDEVALLSPACASLDQFNSYAQRGDKFKECIAKLNLD